MEKKTNIKTIEKILKEVVTEWSNNKAVAKNGNENATQKYTNIFSQTSDEFKIYDKKINDKYDVYCEEWGNWDTYIVYKGTKTKVSEEDEKEYDSSCGIEKLDTPKLNECYFSFWKDKDGYKISLDGKPSWEYLHPSSEFYSSKFDSIFYGAFNKANIEFDWEDDATLKVAQ